MNLRQPDPEMVQASLRAYREGRWSYLEDFTAELSDHPVTPSLSEEESMNLPPYGLCVPCVYRRCRDGHTVEVSRAGSSRVWAIRLIGCNTPELHQPAGPEAKAFAESLLEQADRVSVFIPLPREADKLLRNVLSFGDVLGVVYLDSETTLAERLIRAGQAQARPGRP